MENTPKKNTNVLDYHIPRQIKNLTAEIFNYYYTQKLNNKFSTCVTNSNSVRNVNLNSGIDLSSNTKELKSNRKLNLKFFSEINDNIAFTEEQKMNSKELLKKIDSFLIKKFKESWFQYFGFFNRFLLLLLLII